MLYCWCQQGKSYKQLVCVVDASFQRKGNPQLHPRQEYDEQQQRPVAVLGQVPAWEVTSATCLRRWRIVLRDGESSMTSARAQQWGATEAVFKPAFIASINYCRVHRNGESSMFANAAAVALISTTISVGDGRRRRMRTTSSRPPSAYLTATSHGCESQTMLWTSCLVLLWIWLVVQRSWTRETQSTCPKIYMSSGVRCLYTGKFT